MLRCVVISLLFLTNFRLGGWIRALLQKDSADEEVKITGIAPPNRSRAEKAQAHHRRLRRR
jgi:hypothetical protein